MRKFYTAEAVTEGHPDKLCDQIADAILDVCLKQDEQSRVGFTRSILSFGLLFAGIPTGLIFYSVIVKKWLTSIAPKIIIGFVAFPIYTLAGVIGSISFIIYKGIFIFKNNRCK